VCFCVSESVCKFLYYCLCVFVFYLSVFVYVCVCLCDSPRLCVYLTDFGSLYVYVCLFLYVCLYFCVCLVLLRACAFVCFIM